MTILRTDSEELAALQVFGKFGQKFSLISESFFNSFPLTGAKNATIVSLWITNEDCDLAEAS